MNMKKLSVLTALALSVLTLSTGCLGFSAGGGTKTTINKPTLGQQLMDLQKAHESGAITDAEYQTQKAKLLAN